MIFIAEPDYKEQEGQLNSNLQYITAKNHAEPNTAAIHDGTARL